MEERVAASSEANRDPVAAEGDGLASPGSGAAGHGAAGPVAAGVESGGLARRVLGAVALRGATYQAVAEDERASGQARVVVALAVAAAAAGEVTLAPVDLAWQAAASLLHWWAWAGVIYPAARRRGAAGGPRSGGSAWSVALRVAGFAKAPGILAALAPVPVVGGLFHVAVLPWMLATGAVAARRGLGLSPVKAVATTLLGLLPYWAALALLF